MHASTKPLALYVHIPFCKAKCTYCDFYSIVGRENSIPAYLEALFKEIIQAGRTLDLSGYYIDTIFFGGGTPNLLDPGQIEAVLAVLQDLAQAGENPEIGMEINPGEANLENLRAYRHAGVNRISIGMQSFQPQLLRFMSRIHSVEQSLVTYDHVRNAGFTNVSGDLIFAVPGQTRQLWEADLKQLVSLAPEHISTYSLTVEEGTALHRWVQAGHVQMLEESIDTGMYAWGRQYLESQGYPNYEISNHARPGFECRHNLNYWTGTDYLGFGPAAHSFFQGRRAWNVHNLDQYMRALLGGNSAEEDHEFIDERSAMNEMILTRMRLARGLDLGAFTSRFQYSLLDDKSGEIEKWRDHLRLEAGHLQLTARGWSMVDEITSELMT